MYKIPANTVLIGKKLVFMPECHSTNSFAQDLCQQSERPPEGTVVATANQFAGRGQRGNTWIVEPGKNLTFSIIIYPQFLPVADLFYLNMITSLGILDFLVANHCSARIKWPNDIYVGDKKICGILIENQIRGKTIASSVVGVGLNINQIEFSIDTATSLSRETGNTYDLSDAFASLAAHIENQYFSLRDQGGDSILSDYLKKMYWINEQHVFETESGRVNGAITGVAPDGRIVIRVDDALQYFATKEIRFIS